VQLDVALRERVLPVYDAMKADPKRGIHARKVFAAVRKRHSERKTGK
jgi:antitoxin ParD1/3/4